MRDSRSSYSRGFTLVELLVVIGIIAVLIGILLPVLSGVQTRARDLQCQSNIRQCLNLILTYAAENRGQLPFGFYWSPSGGSTGWEPVGADPKLISVWSIISRMSSKSYDGEATEYGHVQVEQATYSAPFLRCPEALQVQSHLCSYAVSLPAFVTPWEDIRVGATLVGPAWKRLVEKPATTSRCLSFTALLWDTSVQPWMATSVGYVIGGDIDAARIWNGATHPQFRYYSPHDPFARVGQGIHSNNRPVYLDLGSGAPFRNIDPADGIIWPYQGNLRFRHRKNTTCNAGFADGSVRQFTGKFQRDGRPISHDALRKQFMVKWPSGSGIAPDPSLPH